MNSSSQNIVILVCSYCISNFPKVSGKTSEGTGL